MTPTDARAATAVILSRVERRGSLWWATWNGLQWSPTRLADGRQFHGTARLTLATTALAQGYGDRRWATIPELTDLGYRIRRIDRPRGVTVGEGMYGPVYNAQLARRRRDFPGRHDARPPEETPANDPGIRASVLALMPAGLSGIGDVGPHRCLRALVGACVPRSLPNAVDDVDEACLGALVEDLAYAMALSDMGMAPLAPRCSGGSVRDGRTARWADAISRRPDVLIACFEVAEAVAALALATITTEATRRGAAASTQVLPADASDPIPTGGRQPEDSQGRVDASDKHHPHYTLREVAMESERASTVLAKRHAVPNRMSES